MADEHVEPTPLPHLNRALLERLDERTASIQSDLTEIKKELSNKYVTKTEFEPVEKVVESLSDKYVSKDEFAPVKKIVYGLVGLILTAVVVAALGLLLAA